MLVCASLALAAGTVRADGIALSTDGLIWSKGAGDYGSGWGDTGAGISVQQGGTLYIKYYSEVENVTLLIADHGRSWTGQWNAIGPMITAGTGQHANEPIILRISDVGTSKSSVAWMNGRGKSGIWRGISRPGPYDLALHTDAKWTLPPIVVNETPQRPSFWASLFGPSNTAPKPDNQIHSVPDNGATVSLLLIGVLSLAAVRRLCAWYRSSR